MNILKPRHDVIIDLTGMPIASVLRIIDIDTLLDESSSKDNLGNTIYTLREDIQVKVLVGSFTMTYPAAHADQAWIDASNYPPVFDRWFKKLQKIQSSKLLYGQLTGRQYSKIEGAIQDAFIDLLVYLDLARHCYLAFDERWIEFTARCREICPGIQFVQTEDGPIRAFGGRADFFTRLKHSNVYTRNGDHSVNEPIQSALGAINVFEAEYQNSVDERKLLAFLKDCERTLETLKIEDRDFILRFRKLGQFHFNGCYIPSARIIVVDPRQTHVFNHELGHYVHLAGIPFEYNGKRYSPADMEAAIDEAYPRYIGEVASYKHYKPEVYREEVFARWFEHEICQIN